MEIYCERLDNYLSTVTQILIHLTGVSNESNERDLIGKEINQVLEECEALMHDHASLRVEALRRKYSRASSSSDLHSVKPKDNSLQESASKTTHNTPRRRSAVVPELKPLPKIIIPVQKEKPKRKKRRKRLKPITPKEETKPDLEEHVQPTEYKKQVEALQSRILLLQAENKILETKVRKSISFKARNFINRHK